MITLSNGILTARFKELGAELKSLSCDGTEYIWPGDPAFWAGSAPILFPICSGLLNDTYYLDGKKYRLQKHGYGRFCTFDAEAQSDTSVTFVLHSDEDSKKSFPFDYTLRITYTLEGKTLQVRYDTENHSAQTMYFSIGAHEGFYCPEGIEEYEIVLPAPETLDACVLEGAVLGKDTQRILEDQNILPLKYEYFSVDALIFKNLQARSMILRHRNSQKALQLSFPGHEYFLIWSKKDAPFVCLEPWCGITDSVDTDQNIETKEGIRAVAPGEHYVCAHSIEILTPAK